MVALGALAACHVYLSLPLLPTWPAHELSNITGRTDAREGGIVRNENFVKNVSFRRNVSDANGLTLVKAETQNQTAKEGLWEGPIKRNRGY